MIEKEVYLTKNKSIRKTIHSFCSIQGNQLVMCSSQFTL